MNQLRGPQRGGSQDMCAERGDQARGTQPRGPAFGKPRSCFNVNFNSYAHSLRSGTKVSLALFFPGTYFSISIRNWSCPGCVRKSKTQLASHGFHGLLLRPLASRRALHVFQSLFQDENQCVKLLSRAKTNTCLVPLWCASLLLKDVCELSAFFLSHSINQLLISFLGKFWKRN